MYAVAELCEVCAVNALARMWILTAKLERMSVLLGNASAEGKVGMTLADPVGM